ARVFVTVNPVNDAPTPGDTAATLTMSGSTLNVVVDDFDVDGDPLTIISIPTSGTGAPQHGTAIIVNNQIQYMPTSGHYGTDTFSYTVSDGQGGTATAWVTITTVNAPPVATNDTATVSPNFSSY